MDFVTREKDMLYLSNGKVCQVVKCIAYENEAYLLTAEIPETLEEMLQPSPERMKFVKEIVEGDDVMLSTVNDKQLIDKLYAEMKKVKSE